METAVVLRPIATGGVLVLMLILAETPTVFAQTPLVSGTIAAAATPEEIPVEPTRQSWREFFAERTHFGVGFDQDYIHNVFLTKSSQRQQDLLTTLESQVIFADPRGDWLYGGSYEVNAFRYIDITPTHTGFHHEWAAYAYYTPLSRYRVNFSLGHRMDDRLVEFREKTVEIRRFGTFTRADTTSMSVSAAYDLNPTNVLNVGFAHGRFDDQSPDEAAVDNNSYNFGLSLDHDLSKQLTIFLGYAFGAVNFPRASSKDTTDHGVEFGAKYEQGPSTSGQLKFNISQNEINSGTSSLNVGVTLEIRRELSERSLVALTLDRTTSPTVSGVAENVTGNRLALKWKYDLTESIQLDSSISYAHSETDRARSDTGSAEMKFIYPIRPNINANVRYRFEDFGAQDISNHIATIGVEAQI